MNGVEAEPYREAAARFAARTEPAVGRRGWRLERPDLATTSRLFLARPEEQAEWRSVVRIFPNRKTWRQYVERLRLLGEHQLPAPRVLAASRWWEPLIRREPWMLVESFLPGRVLSEMASRSELPADALRELAEDLGRSVGRLHAITGPRHGWGTRGIDAARFHQRLLDLLRRRRETLLGDLSRVDSAWGASFEPALDRLAASLNRWRFSGPFVLVHGELGPEDMLWSREHRSVSFTDVRGLRFNHRHFDLLVVRQWMSDKPGGREAEDQLLQSAYWAEAGAQHRPAAETDQPIIGGMLDVMRMQTRARELKRRPDRRDELCAEIERLHARLLGRALGEGSGAGRGT